MPTISSPKRLGTKELVGKWGITGAKGGYRGRNLGEVIAKARGGGGLMSMDIHARDGYAWAWGCMIALGLE